MSTFMTVTDADQKYMGSYISRYHTVLTRASSLLKKSVKFRPPGQGDAFARWVVEYNHAITSLEHCRTEFQNQVWRDRYFVTNQSPFFLQNISFAENRGKKNTNPSMWWRCKDFNDPNQRDIIEFWKSGMRNEEQHFLGDIIDDFVKIIADETPEQEHPSLVEFEFSTDEISSWVNFHNRTWGKGKIYDAEFPQMPVQCQTWKPGADDSQFKAYEKKWPAGVHIKTPGRNTDQNAAGSNEEYNHRKWFQTRACLAFRKAVRSSLIEQGKRDQYMLYNHIRKDGSRCYVLGMSMSNAL